MSALVLVSMVLYYAFCVHLHDSSNFQLNPESENCLITKLSIINIHVWELALKVISIVWKSRHGTDILQLDNLKVCSKGLVQHVPRLYSGWGFLTSQWDRQLEFSAYAWFMISWIGTYWTSPFVICSNILRRPQKFENISQFYLTVFSKRKILFYLF